MRKMMKQTCPECKRTLQLIEYGKGQIKCPRCGHVIEYEMRQEEGNEQSERQKSS